MRKNQNRFLHEVLKQGKVSWADHAVAATAFYGSRHVHASEHHLSYLQRGLAWMQAGSRSFQIKAGMAVFCPARVTHDARPLAGPEDYLDLLELKFVLPGRPRLPNVAVIASPNEFVGAFKALIAEFRLNRPYRELLLRMHLTHLLALYLRSLAAHESIPAKSVARVRRERTLVESAMKIMHARYDQRITIPALALELGVSASSFAHVFTSQTGLSPLRYLADYRLSRALALMTNTDLKLAAIAEMTGFCGEFHLSHAFRKRYGLSPRRYAAIAANRN